MEKGNEKNQKVNVEATVEEDKQETVEIVEVKSGLFARIDKKKLVKAGIGLAVVAGGLYLINKVTKKPEIVSEVIETVSEELAD